MAEYLTSEQLTGCQTHYGVKVFWSGEDGDAVALTSDMRRGLAAIHALGRHDIGHPVASAVEDGYQEGHVRFWTDPLDGWDGGPCAATDPGAMQAVWASEVGQYNERTVRRPAQDNTGRGLSLPPCEDILSEQYRHIWCGNTDDTGRFVCRRVRDHALDFHAGRNDAGGIHQWRADIIGNAAENMPAAEHVAPADCPVGTVLVDPASGRWAVRFDRGDDTGRGQHVWLSPAGVVHAEARFLHHVEVRGWEVAAARRWGRVADDEPPVDGDLRARCITALSEQVSEFISPDEFGGYDVHYGELVDIVLDVVQPELERRDAELRLLRATNESLLAMLERMETLHVTWFGPNREEFHPEWCRECRVDTMRADRDAARRERDEMRQQRDLVKVELGLERGKVEGAQAATEMWARAAARPAIPADAVSVLVHAAEGCPPGPDHAERLTAAYRRLFAAWGLTVADGADVVTARFRVGDRVTSDEMYPLEGETGGPAHGVYVQWDGDEIAGWYPADRLRHAAPTSGSDTTASGCPACVTGGEHTFDAIGQFHADGAAVLGEAAEAAKAAGSDTTEDEDLRPWRVGADPGVDRNLLIDAVRYVINGRHASRTAIQRNVWVSFAKACQLLDLMETWGVVGPADGSRAREVLVPKDQLIEVVEAIMCARPSGGDTDTTVDGVDR